MYIERFYTPVDQDLVVSAEQGSSFAKAVANDFNPIHDPDSRRFCVPGDLLFALVLHRYGLSTHMEFSFSGMVEENTRLRFPPTDADQFSIADVRDKIYLTVRRSGDRVEDPRLIENLVRNYVKFSGDNFPHILVPLMREKGVMINPDRPLVIYAGMAFSLDTLDFQNLRVELAETSLVVEGKRGDAVLKFRLMESDSIVGTGSKSLVLSGLRDYDQTVIDALVEEYQERKAEWIS